MSAKSAPAAAPASKTGKSPSLPVVSGRASAIQVEAIAPR